jgi:hypothetical protein
VTRVRNKLARGLTDRDERGCSCLAVVAKSDSHRISATGSGGFVASGLEVVLPSPP